MNIVIDYSPSETEWQHVQIGEWLERNDELIVNLANWSPSQLLHRRLDFRLHFRSGEAPLYRYFPFSFKLSANAPQAEIGEIERPDQITELLIEQVAPDWQGRLALSFMSEQSGIPKNLGLGPDERDLALFLESVLVRQPKYAIPSAGIVKGCSDLDLHEQRGTIAPVFVVGSGRCGSSVLTWALGQHPNIMPLDETVWLPMLLYGATAAFGMASGPKLNFPTEYGVCLDRFLQHIGVAIEGLHNSAARSHAQVDFLQRLSGRADLFNPSFQRVRTNWSPKRRWVDGTPLNTSIMPLLARTFPHAQFVAIIRSPADVIASYYAFHTVGGPTYSIEDAATTWLRAAWMVLWMRDKLGSRRVMIVRYEEFAQPDELIRRTLRFLGEANCTSCLKPMQHRMNSSNVGEDVRREIKGPLVDKCATVYAHICAGASWKTIDWGESVNGNYEEWLNDLLTRLIKQIS